MPNKNWPVGVIKKIIPDGPKPDNSTPFTYKNKGITVIGPVRKIKAIKDGLDKEKSFWLDFNIK